ncbi:MAG: hypothetical protein QMD03_00985 [Syntrophales bacterium]|nr:hypothetical protein [Syntrophales bacterium]
MRDLHSIIEAPPVVEALLFWLTQSVPREPEQEAISIFATDRCLFIADRPAPTKRISF